MGFGRSEEADKLVYKIIESSEKPLVIDADGINAVSGNIDILKRLKVKGIITPHPMEMSRLTGMSVSEIQDSRQETAIAFSGKYNVVTVLKGANTVVADSDGSLYINKTGNPGMATGGSGDVLSGILSGICASNDASLIENVIAGAYINGIAGEISRDESTDISMSAYDTALNVKKAITKIIK
jgi:NAD(P)H-hydrate epimerase